MPLKKIRKAQFKPVALSTHVADILSQAILQGDLKGGEQLVEAELQDQFNISRSPLREAFRMLENKGLVTIISRKGTFVKLVSRKDIQENFPVRAALEGLAAKEAFLNMTDEGLAQMAVTLSKMEKAVKAENAKNYYDHHIEFHEIFIRLSCNELLIYLLKTLRMHNLWHRYSFKYYQADLEKSFQIHQRILDLFQNKNTKPKGIRDLVEQHVRDARNHFLSYLEKNQH